MDNRHPIQENINEGCFKEAVCINAQRIYDSCSDKDCIEDLRVYFPDNQQLIVDQATNVRIKKIEIICAYLCLEPVTFNRGFYSVDLTFFFKVTLETMASPTAPCQIVCGAASFNKKVILYGSEGNVKVFTSNGVDDCCCGDGISLPTASIPKAVMQVAEPIGLSAKVCDAHACCDPCCCNIPEKICQTFNGSFNCVNPKKHVYVTIGLFTIIQIVRDVPMLIPAYDFCIPDKECVATSDNPCEIFRKLDFPTNEFFPPKLCDVDDNCGCGCGNK